MRYLPHLSQVACHKSEHFIRAEARGIIYTGSVSSLLSPYWYARPYLFGPFLSFFWKWVARRYFLGLKVRCTPQNTSKHLKTPQNTAKHRKTPQNTAKHRKTPQNTAKHRNFLRSTPQSTSKTLRPFSPHSVPPTFVDEHNQGKWTTPDSLYNLSPLS